MRIRVVVIALAWAGGVPGCASMHPGRGFDNVQREVRARTGADTRWNLEGDEDRQVHAAVQALLTAELTPEAAVQVALLNNRDLLAVYEELDIAQADLVRAGLLRNPVFSGEVRFDTSGGGTGIVLDLTEDFLSLLTMPLRKARAGAAFEAAKSRVSRAAVGLAFDTAGAFYEHVAAEETLVLRATVERAADASYELAGRLRGAGNTRELDLLNEQALHEQAGLDAESAHARVAETRERLNSLMGVWGVDAGWRAEPRLPEPPDSDPGPDDLERRAVAASLELAEARFEIQAAAAGARLARPLAWLEGSDVGVAAEREVSGEWSVGPSLTIPIPIFDLGGAATGEAAARLRQAADRYYASAVRTRAAAREVSAALATARARVTRYRAVVLPLRERIVHETQILYNAMQVSGFQLLQAKRDQIEAGAASIEALLAYWTARGGVLRAIGGGETPMQQGVPPRETGMNINGKRQPGEHR